MKIQIKTTQQRIGARLEAMTDPSLSMKAKGLYMTLLGLSLQGNTSIKDIVDASLDGPSATRAALRELERATLLKIYPLGEDVGEEWVLANLTHKASGQRKGHR